MQNRSRSSSPRSARETARWYSCRSIGSHWGSGYSKPVGIFLRRYPEYPGRERWIDRIFYRGEDGAARPLSAVWEDRVPWMLNGATGILQVLAARQLRGAIRLLLTERGEVLP